MPRIKEDTTPKLLRPYLFHGLDLEGSPNAIGECPFCGKEKFSVSVETGLWRCFVCDEKGNLTSFMRKLWDGNKLGRARTSDLVRDRKVSAESLEAFGVVDHYVTGEVTIPGYSTDRRLMTLYQWVELGGRRVLQQTATVNHQLFIPDDFDPKKEVVYICEGPWDAMALWDALRSYKESGGGLVRTGSVEASLYAEANVIGVPGCGSVGEPFARWCSLFTGKRVVLCFDSDYPRTNNGKVSIAGLDACKRACEIMARSSSLAESVSYLKWGNDGYDKDRKSGYDVRDLLTENNVNDTVGESLSELISMIEPIPSEWVKGRSASSKRGGKVEIECLPCTSFEELERYWMKCMKWIPGLRKALAVCLSSIVSTRCVGDQLWIKLVSPPSTGKTTLAEALAIAKQYVHSTDTMTGLVSGYQVDKEGSENMSFVQKIKDKTLIIKDADTILSSPQLTTILSQFRAGYDRAIRTTYGNKMSAAHEGINMTVIMCGTNSLRKLDASELGERTLDCVIMDKIEEGLESEVLRRKFHQSWRDLSQESNGQPESQVNPAMLAAMQRTGGYVCHLRQNARELLAGLAEPDEDLWETMEHYGKFVAFMRARPSSRQDETAEREFAARLVSQITRLTGCLTVVLNKKVADPEVMELVRSVVMDTARGRTLDIAQALFKEGREGLSKGALELEVQAAEEGRIEKLVKFLRSIGAVESYTKVSVTGQRSTKKYRLTQQVHDLYGRVVGDA